MSITMSARMNQFGILLGLMAALSYGASDFMGGMGGRRTSTGAVVVAQQPFAFLAIITVWAVYRPSSPTAAALGWGALSGLGNSLGTVALYRGLTVGRMSVVAPLSGVLSTAIPAAVGIALGERLPVPEAVGVALAGPAIVLVSLNASPEPGRRSGVWEGLAAGTGFGLLFVALDRAGTTSGAWPLLPGQVVTLAISVPVGLRTTAGRRRALPYGAAAATLGGIATASFLAATGHGKLAVLAVSPPCTQPSRSSWPGSCSTSGGRGCRGWAWSPPPARWRSSAPARAGAEAGSRRKGTYTRAGSRQGGGVMGIFKDLREARKAQKELVQEAEQLQEQSGMRPGLGGLVDMMKEAPGLLSQATGALQQAQAGQAEAARLQAEGVPGMAKLIQARDAGITMTGMGSGMDSPVADLDLEVTLPGSEPFRATVRAAVPRLQVARLAPGAALPVRVDPLDHSKLVVDWNAPIA